MSIKVLLYIQKNMKYISYVIVGFKVSGFKVSGFKVSGFKVSGFTFKGSNPGILFSPLISKGPAL